MSTVTVFGATGAVGQLAVARLLHRGHDVVAYVRNAEKMPAAWADDRVQPVVGSITDRAAVASAVAAGQAVLSALGPSMDRRLTGLPLVEGTRHIVDAMHAHGVTRFVGMATPSVLDVRDRRTFQTRASAFLASHFLPRGYEEMVGMSAGVVTESDLEWTIARFMSPRDGDAKGTIRQGFFGQAKIGWAITRADIAHFIADEVDDDRYVRAAPAISN